MILFFVDDCTSFTFLSKCKHFLSRVVNLFIDYLKAFCKSKLSMQQLCDSSHRNVMMRLGLQLTMGSFSLTLFSLIGVAFGMNLESSLEEVTSQFND